MHIHLYSLLHPWSPPLALSGACGVEVVPWAVGRVCKEGWGLRDDARWLTFEFLNSSFDMSRTCNWPLTLEPNLYDSSFRPYYSRLLRKDQRVMKQSCQMC